MADQPRLFELYRQTDETGVSGTGVVAHGVEFPDGTAVLRWVGHYTSTAIYEDMAKLEAIHGHDGKTKVVWYEEAQDAV